MNAPLRFADEPDRLNALRRYDVLDTPAEDAFDDLTRLMAHVCAVPIALISFVDEERQWFKSNTGIPVSEASRAIAFCAHAIHDDDLFVVGDATQDERFADNPLVTGDPHIRFYAGLRLLTPEGQPIGTLCVIDTVPRELNAAQRDALRIVSHQVMGQLELRRNSRKLAASESWLLDVFAASPVACAVNRLNERTFVRVNAAFTQLTGWTDADLLGRTVDDLRLVELETLRGLRSRLAEHPELHDEDVTLRTRTGDLRHVLLATEMVMLGGEPHTVNTFVDITARKQAEDALRLSNLRYRTLVESACDGILVTDPRGLFVDANAAAGRLLGYSPEELLSLSVEDVLVPSEVGRIALELSRLIAGEMVRSEWQCRRKDGTTFPAEVSAVVLPDNRRLGILRDITDRHQADLHIKRLNRVYAVLSDINKVMVRDSDSPVLLETACRVAVDTGGFRTAWIGLLDADGRIRLTAHAGATPDTLEVLQGLLDTDPCGCSFTEHAVTTGEHGVCDDIALDPDAWLWRDSALEHGYRSMASLPLRVGNVTIGTFNLYSAEPHFFDAEELALLDELAMDIGFATGVRDRELHRRRIEAALHASEDRFRELADNIYEVFWMVDQVNRQLLYVSPAYETIWGRTCASLYESPSDWMDAVHPDDRTRVLEAVETKRPRGDFDETYRIVRPDKSIRWIRDRAFVVRDGSGTVVRVGGTAHDITEQRQLEEQFRQAQKMEAVGQLAGGVAHDFNNILAAISMQAELAASEPGLPVAAQEQLADITTATERAAKLIRQLLTFSRRQVIESRLLNLNDIVTNVASMLQRVLGTNVRLQLHLHPRQLLTRADAGMLDQVLVNLAVNARDAMPDGGTLVLDTSERLARSADATVAAHAPLVRFVCLRVTDTGEGIAEEYRARIFEPFFTTKEEGKGTGLGLATVFGIVKQHGGFIDVESEVGRGTTFSVFFPAAPETEQPDNTATPRAEPRGGAETILVVDDDASVRTVTAVVLRRAGYAVLEAKDGVQAIRMWEERRGSIQLVLTDVMMPGGLNGHELAAQLHARDAALQVIFTSGYDESSNPDLPTVDRQHFVQKPFSRTALLDAVRGCLDG